MTTITTDDISIELDAMKTEKDARFELDIISDTIALVEETYRQEQWSMYDQFTAAILQDDYANELDRLYSRFDELTKLV